MGPEELLILCLSPLLSDFWFCWVTVSPHHGKEMALPCPRQRVHDVHRDIPDDVELGQEPERAQLTHTWSVYSVNVGRVVSTCVLRSTSPVA
jgi:hypothetical protein